MSQSQDEIISPMLAEKQKIATRATIRKWEEQGKLDPVPAPNMHGGPNRNGSSRSPAFRPNFSKALLLERSKEREFGEMKRTHNGIYEEDAGARINMRVAAELAVLKPRRMRDIVDEADPETRIVFAPEDRKPPGRGKPELTILLTGLQQYLAARKAAWQQFKRLKDSWDTGYGIGQSRGIETVPDQLWLKSILKIMREMGPAYARKELWPIPPFDDPLGRCPANRLRKLWIYNLDRFEVEAQKTNRPSPSTDQSCRPLVGLGSPPIRQAMKGSRGPDKTQERTRLEDRCLELSETMTSKEVAKVIRQETGRENFNSDMARSYASCARNREK